MTDFISSLADIFNPWGPKQPVSLYTWLNTNTALISPIDDPASAEYPNPRGALYPVSLRTWINSGIQAAPDVSNVPCAVNGWFNPWGPKRPVADWNFAVSKALQAPVAAPIRPLAWPVPDGKPYAVTLRTWTYQGTLNTAPPFRQLDWPNPILRTRLELGTLNQVIRIDGVKPINQLSWPNPILRTRLELGTFYQKTIADGLKPFSQLDWPNPLLRTRADVGWANPSIQAAVAPPFYQSAWPNPLLRVRLELGVVNPGITSTVAAAPFYQLDWLNPARRISSDVSWLNQVIRFDGLKPVVPQVWVNPRGPQYPVSLLTWAQSPTPQIVTLSPCSVTGWAVPWGPAYPVGLRVWPQINGTIRIPVVPKPKVTYDYPNPRGPEYPVALRTWLQTQQRPNPTGDHDNLPCIPGTWFNPWGPAPRQVAPIYPFRYDPAAVDTTLLPSQANFFNPWGPQYPVELRTWLHTPQAAAVDYTIRGATFFKIVPRSYHAALQLRLGTLVQTLIPPNDTDLSSLADFLNPWGRSFDINTMFGSLGRLPSSIPPQINPRAQSVFFNPPGPRFNVNLLFGANGRIADLPQADKQPCQANFFNPWGPKHHNNLFGYVRGVNPDMMATDFTTRVPLITRYIAPNYAIAISSQLPQNVALHTLGNYPCVPAAYFPPWGPRRNKELLTWLYNWEGAYGPVAPPPKTAFDYPNPRGPVYPVSLRTHINIPFVRPDTFFGLAGQPNYDWPNPRGPQFPLDLRTQLNFAKQIVPPAPPPPNTDWPNPRGATPATTLRTWLDQTRLQLIGQDSLPLRQLDWPNPRGAQRPVADFVEGLNDALLFAIPISQLDWPNPRGAQRPVADWVQGLNSPLLFTIPIRQPDWPNPRGAQRPASELQWINGNTINLPPTPLFQTDWPNPRGAKPASTLNTWINNTQQQLIGKDALPSRQSEWPVPKGPIPGVSLRTFDNNNTRYIGKDTFFGLAGHPNFNWPNPWGPRPLDIYTMLNGFSLPNAPVPPPDPTIHNLRFLADVGPMTSR